MDINLDTGKLVVFIGGLLLFLAINTVTIRILAYVPFLLWIVYVEEEGWGISRWLHVVGWTEIILSVVILDLFDYFWHRANHRVNILWRFHKAHHSDIGMDVSTALRFHPTELLMSSLIKALWVVIWGPTVVAWFLFEALVSLCAQFHHSNIDFPDWIESWLSWIIVTPRYHAAHHAVDRKWGDANFSTILSIWDRMFGTYSRPENGGATTNAEDALGLPEGRHLTFSPIAWLVEPFRSDNLNLDEQAANTSRGSSK